MPRIVLSCVAQANANGAALKSWCFGDEEGPAVHAIPSYINIKTVILIWLHLNPPSQEGALVHVLSMWIWVATPPTNKGVSNQVHELQYQLPLNNLPIAIPGCNVLQPNATQVTTKSCNLLALVWCAYFFTQIKSSTRCSLPRMNSSLRNFDINNK